MGKNVALKLNDFEAIARFVDEYDVNMVVVGPEDPLVNGITDFLRKRPGRAKFTVVGPSKEGAIL